MHCVYLKTGREDSLIRRHPWLFSGAIAKVTGKPQAGETVLICNAEGETMAVGAYSPVSQIRVRIWDFAPDTRIDTGFLRARLERALASRERLYPRTNALRLVYSEADYLPGLIVDRYEDVLVCQFLSVGAEFHKAVITALLSELVPCQSIYERSDSQVREKEGLQPVSGLLVGNEPPDLIEIQEYGIRYLVDVRNGHKTGFYLDQRDNRAYLRTNSHAAQVLNCFAYTGGFGLAALAGGARQVINLDSSGQSLRLAARNAQLNGYAPHQFETIEANAFDCLRQLQEEDRSFDIIILDPPKFVDSKAQTPRGARAYKDINLQAFKLLRPGGYLFSFSCSGLLPAGLFQKIVADAALDAHCDAQIVQRFGQAGDHPVSLNFPEAEYLKGFCVRKAS